MGTRNGSGVLGGHYRDANRADAHLSSGFSPPGSMLIAVVRGVSW
jgi:hypothetical protein